MFHPAAIKLINLLCLLAAVVMILVLPRKKQIWYDESVSMMCSNGISGRDPGKYKDTKVFNSVELHDFNTAANVFNATVDDNANSFIYNIGLHWFTVLFGNTLASYMMFSKICALFTLLAVFMLCGVLAGASYLPAMSAILMATDLTFVGMSHEIRAYAMGMTFVTFAAVYFFRYVNGKQNPFNLLLVGLFSVGAVLSHFLSIYIVFTFYLSLLILYRQRLFRPVNILVMIVPVVLVGVYFFYAFPGLMIMKERSTEIKELTMDTDFSVWHVFSGTLRFLALNFRMVFPVFIDKFVVVFFSLVAVGLLYFFALRFAAEPVRRRNLHLLFGLGISSSVMLAILCLKSGHYAALYYRYHSFALPFSIMFVAYALHVLIRSNAVLPLIKVGAVVFMLAPAAMLFISSERHANPPMKYNHLAVADEIVKKKASEIVLPGWRDAFLINTVLPREYKIDYVLNELDPYFTLKYNGQEERIRVVVSKH
jgi:hypothetical protein